VALALAVPATASAETWIVNETGDSVGEETCPERCTLRGAIAVAGPEDLISVPAGRYVLDPMLGPLTFFQDTTIVGAGARSTVISGGDATRVAEIVESQVAISSATLTAGLGSGQQGPRGGAVYVDFSGSLVLTDSAVTDSASTDDGGGIYSEGQVELLRSTVSGNRASGDGGGIFQGNVESEGLTLTSSTVSGNSATASGGGIYSVGLLALTRSTIAGNSARAADGLWKQFGTARIADTIVAAVTGNACGGQWEAVTTYSLSSDSSCLLEGIGDRQGVDPLLGPLTDNGGPTDTHALPAVSPAIGAANPDPTTCSGTDQRGVVRPQGGSCDIGAYEYVASQPSPAPPPRSVQSQPPPPTVDDPLPPPVTGKRVNVEPKRGTIRIKVRGTRKFVRLREGMQVRIGTVVDARKGHVILVAAANRKGRTVSVELWAGIFKVGQTKGRRPITTLELTEKLRCGKSKAKAATSKKKKRRKKKRRLWGDGKGRFRTKGEFSSATVRGTKWLVEDRCASTLTRVVRGKVTVRDFVKTKTVVVRKGKRYRARAR